MTLFPRNQRLDNLGIYRARSMQSPHHARRLGICHCQPPAALIAGTTEPLPWLWRRPVAKSPGPSSPLLARYRARRMDLCRLGSFHRGFAGHEALLGASLCTMAPEMCRLINAWVRSFIALQETCLFIRHDFSHESSAFSFHRNQNSLNHGDRLNVTLILPRPA